MSESNAFASLSPSLLARKGGAKPAMRPQLQPIQQFHEATARDMGNDLGWNDMGEDVDTAATDSEKNQSPPDTAEIVSIGGVEHSEPDKPPVLQQQEELARSVDTAPAERKSALERGRRAAFTLRLDADRHLQLRLASTVSNRSAQQIVTEALDQLLEGMPEIAALASKVRKNT